LIKILNDRAAKLSKMITAYQSMLRYLGEVLVVYTVWIGEDGQHDAADHYHSISTTQTCSCSHYAGAIRPVSYKRSVQHFKNSNSNLTTSMEYKICKNSKKIQKIQEKFKDFSTFIKKNYKKILEN